MPLTPITTPAKINQQTGLVLAYFGYDRTTTPSAELKATLEKSGWLAIDSTENKNSRLITTLGKGYNTQTNATNEVQNGFNVFVNKEAGQITFSFKGSDAFRNFKSDLLDNGATEFNSIADKAQKALDVIRAQYPGYQVVAVGHSLGGGMAQTFAVKNGLDAQVYNSLPIARQSVEGAYFGGAAGFDSAYAQWLAAGHQVHDVRTANDLATFFYNNDTKGVYLSALSGQAATILPGVAVPDFIKGLSLIPISPTAIVFGAAYGTDHMMAALIDASQGLGTNPSTGKFIIPSGQANLMLIPPAVREQFQRLQNASPISEVRPEGENDFIIKRQDGSEQRVKLDRQNGDVRITQPNGSGGTLELRMNVLDEKAPIEVLDLDADGKLRSGAKVGEAGSSLTSRSIVQAADGSGPIEVIVAESYRISGEFASSRTQDINLATGLGHVIEVDANGEVVNDVRLARAYVDDSNTAVMSDTIDGMEVDFGVAFGDNGTLWITGPLAVNGNAIVLASAGDWTTQDWMATTAHNASESSTDTYAINADGSRVLTSTLSQTITTLLNGQDIISSETIYHQASGSAVANVKEVVFEGGAKLVNITRADGHLEELSFKSEGGLEVQQSAKVLSYSQAERDSASTDVALAGLEFMQALRHGNQVLAASSLVRLVNQAQIASNTQPVLGAVGTGLSGAISLLSAMDSWGSASDAERIAVSTRAVLGANEVARAFSVDGKTGFLDDKTGFLDSSRTLGALQGVVALATLEDTLHSGNPFAIASSVMALTNAAVSMDLIAASAQFGPQAMIAVAIASIIFGGLFGESVRYPSPPPAGQAEIGQLADGSLGLVLTQFRTLTGQPATDFQPMPLPLAAVPHAAQCLAVQTKESIAPSHPLRHKGKQLECSTLAPAVGKMPNWVDARRFRSEKSGHWHCLRPSQPARPSGPGVSQRPSAPCVGALRKAGQMDRLQTPYDIRKVMQICLYE